MARRKRLYKLSSDVSKMSDLTRKINSVTIKQDDVLKKFDRNNFTWEKFSEELVSRRFEKLTDLKIIDDIDSDNLNSDYSVMRKGNHLEIITNNSNCYDNSFNFFYNFNEMWFVHEIVPLSMSKGNKKSLEQYGSMLSRKISLADSFFQEDVGLIVFCSYLENGKYDREVVSRKVPRINFIDLGYRPKTIEQKLWLNSKQKINYK